MVRPGVQQALGRFLARHTAFSGPLTHSGTERGERHSGPGTATTGARGVSRTGA